MTDVVIFLGPPGCGKGTQADVISDKTGLVKLSTGDMLRSAVKSGSDLGKKLKSVMDAGELVSDEIIVAIIKERLNQSDCSKGVILDGFPRTLPQAEALGEMLSDSSDYIIKSAIKFDIADEILVGRIAGRFSCSNCGAGYHDHFKKPVKEGVCDNCGSREFTRRSDDNEATVKSRLQAFYDSTEPLYQYYHAQGLLAIIDADRPIDEVTAKILGIVK